MVITADLRHVTAGQAVIPRIHLCRGIHVGHTARIHFSTPVGATHQLDFDGIPKGLGAESVT